MRRTLGPFSLAWIQLGSFSSALHQWSEILIIIMGLRYAKVLMTLIHVIGEGEEYHLTQQWFFTIKQNSLQDLSYRVGNFLPR